MSCRAGPLREGKRQSRLGGGGLDGGDWSQGASRSPEGQAQLRNPRDRWMGRLEASHSSEPWVALVFRV